MAPLSFPLTRAASRRPSGRSSTPILLGASLGLVALTTVLAFVSAWSARANTRQLLRDYAAFAAWSYKQHLGNDLEEAAWLTLGPINHREPHHSSKTPTAAELPHYRDVNLAECHCQPPAHPGTYYRFALGSDTLTTAGALAAPGLSSSLPPVIRALVRGNSTLPRLGIIGVPGRTEVVAYGLMPTAWGDTIVYGFTFDSLSLIAGFDSVLQRASLLPTAVTHGHPNHELLGLEIRNAAGALLHRSPGWPVDEKEWPYIAAESLPPLRGGFVARLTLNPASAPALLAGGLPKTPLAVLVAIGVLGVMAALVALAQLRREDELSRLRTGFVAGVSHELRTPLAQMRLFLDTLRLKRYDTEVERDWLMGHLTRETTRLEHLVENVLAVSRLDRGVVSEAPLEPLDLGREVGEAVSAFAPLAASRQVELSTELQGGVGVLADQAALRQLLLNLLDNAVKFGPPGQVVRLRVWRRNGSAALSVTDQGPGVGEPDRERIWEPYYRGSNSATRAVGGSGIGLAIVREVATRFGGSVSVTAPAGGGAEFTVTFPTLGDRGGDA